MFSVLGLNISTGHTPQVKSIQVTAPSINYQTTKITLDLIEYFVLS